MENVSTSATSSGSVPAPGVAVIAPSKYRAAIESTRLVRLPKSFARSEL